MSTLVRSVLGVALLVTGASAAMAQSANQPVAAQPAKTGASTAVTASNNAPVANQTVQTGASTAVAGSAQKPRGKGIADNTDRYGGHDPNSTAGARAFWEGVNPY